MRRDVVQMMAQSPTSAEATGSAHSRTACPARIGRISETAAAVEAGTAADNGGWAKWSWWSRSAGGLRPGLVPRPPRARGEGARGGRRRARSSRRLDVIATEDSAGWVAVLRRLVPQRLKGGPDAQSWCEECDRGRAWCEQAALPHALHAEPAHARASQRARRRRHDAAYDLRAA